MRKLINHDSIDHERMAKLKEPDSATNHRAHVIMDELGENGVQMNDEDWRVTFEVLILLLGMPTCEELITDMLIDKIEWEVVAEDDDEKRLEAVVGKYQLDWEIDYVHGTSVIAVSEEMHKRPDAPHEPVEV